MIDKPSLLDSPNLINAKEYTVSPIPGASVDDCYAHQSIIRGDYDGTDVNEWNVGKLVQETLPAAEWDAFCHDLTGFGWQITEVVRSIWEEIYCLIHGAQVGYAQEALTQLLSGAQTFTNKTISFYSNTLTGVVSVDTAQTLTNKTISFDDNTLQNVASLNTAQTLTNKTISFNSNTLTNVASLNTTQTLTNKTLDLASDTNIITVGTADRVLVSDANKKIVPTANTTVTEIEYVHGVTSAIQTQIDSKQPNITGAATTITSSNLTASKALVSDASGKVAVSATTSTELGYVSGVTSAIQTQIDSKQPTITGAATSITSSDLTASKALVSDASGKVAASSVTSTELGYVSGVTSAIQTQINSKQATITGAASTITSSDLTASKVLVSDASGKVAAGSIDSSKVVGTDSTQTLTNKTMTFADNTLTGVASTSTTQTLTNKTIDKNTNIILSSPFWARDTATITVDREMSLVIDSSSTLSSYTISDPPTGQWGLMLTIQSSQTKSISFKSFTDGQTVITKTITPGVHHLYGYSVGGWTYVELSGTYTDNTTFAYLL